MMNLVKGVIGICIVLLLVIAGIGGGSGWSLMALTETYGGRVTLCLVMGALGLLLTLLGTGIAWVANGLTEVRRPLGRWFLGLGLVFVAPALIVLLVVTGIEVTHRAADHLPSTIAVIATVALALVIVLARRGPERRPTPRLTEADAAIPAPAPLPQPGHFLPDNQDQWPR